MKKLLFIDIDGTLRDDNKMISTSNKESLKKIEENGYSIVLASGRPLNKVLKVCQECSLNSSYVITTDGAQVYDICNKKFIYREKMDVSDVLFLIDLVKEYHCSITVNSNEKSHRLDFQTIDSFKNLDEVSQVVICSDIFLDLVEIKKRIIERKSLSIVYQSRGLLYDDKNLYTLDGHFLDISNASVSKGNAILHLLSFLDEKAYTICIGDGENDTSMFDVCDFKVAMKNAVPSLLERADFVTLSNNENGVSFFLETLLK